MAADGVDVIVQILNIMHQTVAKLNDRHGEITARLRAVELQQMKTDAALSRTIEDVLMLGHIAMPLPSPPVVRRSRSAPKRGCARTHRV